MNDRFGVGACGVAMTRPFEFSPERLVIVDFAIEHDPSGAKFVGHRLAAGHEINDAQSAVRKVDRVCDVTTALVGSAVADAIGHATEYAFRVMSRRRGDETSYSTHGNFSRL
jgi:hypothetical protein